MSYTPNPNPKDVPPPYVEYDSNTNSNLPETLTPPPPKYDTLVMNCTPLIREQFIGKVYSILSFQMILTFVVGLVVQRNPTLQAYMLLHPVAWWLCTIVSILTCIWLSVAPRAEDYELPTLLGVNGFNAGSYLEAQVPEPERSREVRLPWYVLTRRGQLGVLGVFTLCEAYVVTQFTLFYDADVVLQAILVTGVVVMGVTAVSLSGKFSYLVDDDRVFSIYYWLNWALWVMIGIGISSLFFGMGARLNFWYGVLGSIVFTIYLLIDTQMIFRKVYPNEEVKCAMMLYLDIVNLFISILRVVGSGNGNDN